MLVREASPCNAKLLASLYTSVWPISISAAHLTIFKRFVSKCCTKYHQTYSKANFTMCTTCRYANNQTEMDAKLEELFAATKVLLLVVFVVSSAWSKNVDI